MCFAVLALVGYGLTSPTETNARHFSLTKIKDRDSVCDFPRCLLNLSGGLSRSLSTTC